MKTRLSIVGVALAFLLLPFFIATQVSADETTFTRVERITPENVFLYKIKRAGEKFRLRISITPNSKIKYYKKLSQKRLAELKQLAEKKDVAYIENASQRYESTIGEMVEFMSENNMSNNKEDILLMLDDQKKVVISLLDNYEFNNAQWRFVKNDENSIELYKNKMDGIN